MRPELLNEIVTTYRRHGWRLRSLLLRPESHERLRSSLATDFESADVRAADYDAAWFARQSGAPGREAWELRLIAESPYALFEVFEPDEPEEDRADVRREMEARMGDRVAGRTEPADEGELPLDE